MKQDQDYAEYQELSERIRSAVKEGLKETKRSDDKQRAKFIHQRVMDVLDPILDFTV